MERAWACFALWFKTNWGQEIKLLNSHIGVHMLSHNSYLWLFHSGRAGVAWSNIQAKVLTAYSNVHLSGHKTRHYPAQKTGDGYEKEDSGGGAEHQKKECLISPGIHPLQPARSWLACHEAIIEWNSFRAMAQWKNL